MKPKMSYFKLFTAGLVSTTLFLSACQNDGQSGKGRQADGSGTVTTNAKTDLSAAQKEHLKDITKTTLYKDHLAVLLKQLSPEDGVSFENLVHLKRWVVGPINLEEVKDELSKVMHDKEAVVKQKQYEIFIKTDVLEKMPVADQGDLVRMEFFKGLYLLKNLKALQFCELAEDTFEGFKCEQSLVEKEEKKAEDDASAKKQDAEARSKAKAAKSDKQSDELNQLAEDYEKENDIDAATYSMTNEDLENIRLLMAYIKEKGTSLTQGTLKLKMQELHFDMKIFDFKVGGKVKSDRDITPQEEDPSTTETSQAPATTQNGKRAHFTAEETAQIFSQLEALNGQTMKCLAVAKDETQDCTLEVKAHAIGQVDKDVNVSANYLTINVLSSNKETLLSEKIYKVPTVTYSKAPGQVEGNTDYIIPLTSFGLEERVVGKGYYMNYLVVNETAEGKKVDGIISLPGAVKSVSISDTTGKTTCVAQKAAGTETLFTSKSGIKYTFVYQIVEKVVPPAPCW